MGDTASKEFFLALHSRHTSVGIKKIKEGQALLTKLPDVLQAFVRHYEKVFTVQGDSPARAQGFQDFLDVAPKWLSKFQQAFCDLLLTIDDLKEAIFSMANDKAPGCDGFPCEFYKSLWPCVGTYLLVLSLLVVLMVSPCLSHLLNLSMSTFRMIPSSLSLRKKTMCIPLFNV